MPLFLTHGFLPAARGRIRAGTLCVGCRLEPLGKDRDGLFMCENGQSSAWRLDGGTRSVSPGVEPRRRVPVGYGSRSATQNPTCNLIHQSQFSSRDTLVHAATVRIVLRRPSCRFTRAHPVANRHILQPAMQRLNEARHARLRDRPALSTFAPDSSYRLYRGQDHLFM